MKKINKKEPVFFSEFVDNKHPKVWDELSTEIKYNSRKYMLTEEQNYQCAYTETYITPDNSHIDHFKKRSLFQNLVLDWNNLLASCNSEYYGAKFKDKKIQKTDYKYLINPVKKDPHLHFKYSLTGEILFDKEDLQAQKTIFILNLNDLSLIGQRKEVANHVISMYKQLSVDEIISFIRKFESFIRFIYNDLTTLE